MAFAKCLKLCSIHLILKMFPQWFSCCNKHIYSFMHLRRNFRYFLVKFWNKWTQKVISTILERNSAYSESLKFNPGLGNWLKYPFQGARSIPHKPRKSRKQRKFSFSSQTKYSPPIITFVYGVNPYLEFFFR